MLLEMAAEPMGDRLAVGGRADGVTYEELLDRARRTAAVLSAAGVERVGFVDVNSVMLPQLLFGSGIAGLPFAPVNYRLADDRLRAVLARLAPALVVADDAEVDRMAGELSDILDHVETMNELDLEGVEPTSHVVDLTNVLREDVPRPSLDRDTALEQAPDAADGGFRVPSPGAS